MQENNNLYNKSFGFAKNIVAVYKSLVQNKKEFILAKQLLRCGTSIGANIAEANGAISRTDFSSKISIANKECLETKYWIDLLKDSGYLEDKLRDSLFLEADELAKILFSILKTTRIQQTKKD